MLFVRRSSSRRDNLHRVAAKEKGPFGPFFIAADNSSVRPLWERIPHTAAAAG